MRKRSRAASTGLRLPPWLIAAAVFVLALGVRVWWVRHGILAPYGDQPSLEAFAANVAHGLYYGTKGAYWPPAFIFLAGAVERLFGTGHDYLAVRTANAVVGALTAVLAADLARRLVRSVAAGLIAGVMVALYAPAIYYCDTFLAATLETFTFVACCAAVVAYGERPGPWRLALVGVALGVAALTKPVQLPLIVPAFIHWGLRGRRGWDWRFAGRSAAAALVVAIAVNLPWAVRNLRVTGVPVFVDVNGGVNFYIAHNPRATGAWMDLGPADPVLLQGSGYDRPDTSHLAFAAGWRYFTAHPGRDAQQARGIVRAFWTEADADVATYGDGLAPVRTVLHLPLVGFGLLRDLMPLGLLCLALRRRAGVLLVLTLAGYCGGLALLFFAPRFRLPVEPLMAVVDAGAVWQLLIWWAREWAVGQGVRDVASASVRTLPQAVLSPSGRMGA